MTSAELEGLFSREPASFTFADAPIGARARRLGSAPGAAMEIEERAVVLMGVFAPDDTELAQRNGILMQLLLTALRPDWPTGATWLAEQMKAAGRSHLATFETPNYARQVHFKFDRRRSWATLRVEIV